MDGVVARMKFEPMLTVQEIAELIKRPQRYVRGLVKSGAIKAIKLGGNSWRVEAAEYRRWLERGAPCGFRHAPPSGGMRPGMVGWKEVRSGK